MQKHLGNVRFFHFYIADEPLSSCNVPEGTNTVEWRLCHFPRPKSQFDSLEIISLSLSDEMKVCLSERR